MRLHRYMSERERFDAQHVPVPEAGCWLWTGSCDRDGYPLFMGGGYRRAHRWALAMRLGRELLPGAMACHKCDTPSCVNPAHLYEGNATRNNRDKIARGRIPEALPFSRAPWCLNAGETHHSAKLTPESVLAIRASGKGVPELAAEYGISTNSIRKILKRQTWAHVQQQEKAA